MKPSVCYIPHSILSVIDRCGVIHGFAGNSLRLHGVPMAPDIVKRLHPIHELDELLKQRKLLYSAL